jgi:hypothetical protein
LNAEQIGLRNAYDFYSDGQRLKAIVSEFAIRRHRHQGADGLKCAGQRADIFYGNRQPLMADGKSPDR